MSILANIERVEIVFLCLMLFFLANEFHTLDIDTPSGLKLNSHKLENHWR